MSRCACFECSWRNCKASMSLLHTASVACFDRGPLSLTTSSRFGPKACMQSNRQGPVPISIVSVRLPTCLAKDAPLGGGTGAASSKRYTSTSRAICLFCADVLSNLRTASTQGLVGDSFQRPRWTTPVAPRRSNGPTSKRPSRVSTMRPVVSSTISSPSLGSAMALALWRPARAGAAHRSPLPENALLGSAASRCRVQVEEQCADESSMGLGVPQAACRGRGAQKSGLFHLPA